MSSSNTNPADTPSSLSSTAFKPASRGRVAILWRGDDAARQAVSPETSRFKAIFAALAEVGVEAEPVIYEDDVRDAVRAQLGGFDGALVWVNPIHDGRNRNSLDAVLRDVAARNVWVSTHPDVVLKMGTKEVLFRTRSMGWGSDTARYQSPEEMRNELPGRLQSGPRVIKRNRGNGGQGVWKVEALPGPQSIVRVLDATQEDVEELPLDEFLERCVPYFNDGCVIDQEFAARLNEGVVRCYMSGQRCAGFGHQKVRALVEPEARAVAGPRVYVSKDEPKFQRLRRLMEDEWTPQLASVLSIATHDLPIIWDADFMLGPKTADGHDSYLLGEINVSSVFPIPDEAPQEIALSVVKRLQQRL